MKSALSLLACLVLFSATAFGAAKAEEFKQGVDYELVNPPQTTVDPSKVEVMEFFWYGCPHCYHFEPDLNAWLKKKPDNVVFIRQPAVFNARWAAHAKAYYTAETLGVLDKVHADLYDAIQNKKQALESEAELAKFFADHGVADGDFRKAYKSFAVDTKMRQAETMAARYGVTGTPNVIVNGKYRIAPQQAKSFPRMIAIMNDLIEKESSGAKGAQ
ncbi:thiol:disulfide interchange protein DsbA/DsbL [Methylocaldum gracile]|jgi:thiol:disulfide interchange protein DsbA|uniref:thiol:disulfide interchange protein DsbA/DsbL n=1 Tax=unclassified Methylocaldum TaxID=2622260 RepID=UPI00105B20C9